VLAGYACECATKPDDCGTGLGLASVKAIVDRLGGYVELAPEVGKGTTLRAGFRVTDLTRVSLAPARFGSLETVIVAEDDDTVPKNRF
jgi:hypothetical protein